MSDHRVFFVNQGNGFEFLKSAIGIHWKVLRKIKQGLNYIFRSCSSRLLIKLRGVGQNIVVV